LGSHHGRMRLVSIAFPIVGACTGIGLAVLGFQASSATTTSDAGADGTDVPAVGRPLPAAPARVSHHWAACEHRAHLVHGVCVTIVHRTVTVYDAPLPRAVEPPSQGGPPQDGSARVGRSSGGSPHPVAHHVGDRRETTDAEHQAEHGPEPEHEDAPEPPEPPESTQPEVVG
jgi:hypothetical protein